jgi:hypothetical protein
VKDEKPPIILSREDALQHAAKQLRGMASGFSLAAVLSGLEDQDDLPDPTRKKIQEMRARMPEPQIQADACNAAADTIDALLLEERIVAARVKAGAGVRP